MFGYLVTFALGYGTARLVDNPDRVRGAARAVADEGRRIGTSVKQMRGRASGRARRKLKK